jgi:very-short-patch-repair endonuclease
MDELSTVSFCRNLRKTMTKAEVVLWTRLRGGRLNGMRFRRQHPIGPFVADFACVKARLVIEVDGMTHASDEARSYDLRRTQFLRRQGWREIRVENSDVLCSVDGVVAYICAALAEGGSG